MRGITAGALRYRSGQAVALFVLSTLAVAACAFGPLYERAVEQAQLKLTVANTQIVNRGLSVRQVSPPASLTPFLPSGPLRRFYDQPVTSRSITAFYPHGAVGRMFTGGVVIRTGMCAHLRLASGRCASAPGEVLASASEAKALGLALGERLPITIQLPFATGPQRSRDVAAGSLVVVGSYLAVDPHTNYWFGHEYSTTEGVQRNSNPSAVLEQADTLLAAPGTVDQIKQHVRASVTGVGDATAIGDVTEADVALRPDRLHLDDMSAVRSGVAALIVADKGRDVSVDVQTRIGDVLAEADRGRHQARSVIPAFAVELALLVLVVVGVVVVAAADQRRPEFALARLRGRSAGRTARLLDREFLVPVLLSIVPGLLVAWLGGWLACRWWLSGSVHPESRWPVAAAAAGVVLAELLVVAVVARRAARRPVHDMLRRVPQRSARLRLGVAEAALAAAAIAGLVVTLSGSRHNALAVIVPGLLALLAGLVLGRVLAWSAQAAGRRALWRGRLTAGVAYLQIARRPGQRYVVALLCVATALIVSAADQWRVASRNRSVRAGVEAGASVALTVRASSVQALENAVAAADPSGRYATPVVIQRPVNGPAVMAVSPASFGRIAAWGWARDRPDTTRLTPRRPPPVMVTGTSLRLRLTGVVLKRHYDQVTVGRPNPGPAWLQLNLRRANGAGYDVKLGPLPEPRDRGRGANGQGKGLSRSATLTAAVSCPAGCRLQQIQLLRTTSDNVPISLDATIAELAGGRPGAMRAIAMGTPSDWAEATAELPTRQGIGRIGLKRKGDALELSLFNHGQPAIVQHLDRPVAIPALVAGDVPDQRDARGYLSDNGIDGVAASYAPRGSLPVLPGSGGPTLLVDLEVAADLATPTLGDSTAAVWLSTDDPGRERALVAALGGRGVSVIGRDTAAAHRAVLAQSAPAWAMQLALVTAVLAVLIAAMVILISAAAARRNWAYDMSALELAGVRRATLRRAALVEQGTAAVAGVLVGAAMGLIGAHLALPSIPMFLTDVTAPAVLLPTAWASAGVAALLTLLALVVAGALVGLTLVRQITPDRVRGGQQ